MNRGKHGWATGGGIFHAAIVEWVKNFSIAAFVEFTETGGAYLIELRISRCSKEWKLKILTHSECVIILNKNL